MSQNVFDDARNRINASLIESMFSAPGAYWDGDDYCTLNPTRGDKHVGSFRIKDTGVWFDHATKEGGDLIDLVIHLQALSGPAAKPKAAEWIVRAAGGVVEDFKPQNQGAPGGKKTRKKEPKAPSVTPIPPEALEAIKGVGRSDWARKKYGDPVKAWVYANQEGPVYLKIRYENCPSGKSKEFAPFFWDGQRARVGLPPEHENNRPLLGLKALLANPNSPVVGVEGEKAWDALKEAMKPHSWVVISFDPSGNGVAKTDWSPLVGRAFTYWPDQDLQTDKEGNLLPRIKQPGLSYAATIKAKLPQTKVLHIEGRSDGWDAADAMAEGIAPLAFITSTPEDPDLPTKAPEGPPEDPPGTPMPYDPDMPEDTPFVALGYDSEAYYFLKKRTRAVFAIAKGNFNGSKLLEVASLSWWSRVRRGKLITENGNIRVPRAQDMVQALAEEAGRFDIAKLRGAGVWRDGPEGQQLVVNDGRRIVLQDGQQVEFDAWKTGYHYITSDSRFPGLSGDSSTDAEGKSLMTLVKTQGWTNNLQAISVLGWALIAPFGGILRWRPHLWITGRRGTGKSYVLENVIDELLGDFRHTGSGKDTAAAIYRALNQDAKPVRLDEMEPETPSDIPNIHAILTVARNSSSDASARRTISDGNGIRTFITRSCFCFASVAIPEFGAAIQSRIIRAELSAAVDQAAKIDETKKHIAVMAHPERFRRRIFRALPQILADIDYLRRELLGVVGDQRQVDQLAPLLAAAWAVQSSASISCPAGEAFVRSLHEEASATKIVTGDDETRVIEHILGARIPMTEGGTKPVAELLSTADGPGTGRDDAAAALSRVGIRFKDIGAVRHLAIATKSDAIKAALKDTVYAAGYDQQVKRHKLCATPNEAMQVRFKLGSVRARLFAWVDFKALYIGSEDGQGEFS